MKNFVGSVLFFLGLATLIYTGINYINETESFSFLGIDVLVSKGKLAPMVVSGVVMLIGLGIKPKY